MEAISLSLASFCEGFFHIDECFEWQQKEICLCSNKCARMIVHGIIVMRTAGEIVYIKNYINEFKGSSDLNIHVEDFVVSDPILQEKILFNKSPDTTLTLYITYQPCHHSAGGRKSDHKHAKSCTNTILNWDRHGIKLIIKCCGLYRVHWEDNKLFEKTTDVKIFGKKISSASSGLLLLLSQNDVEVEAMQKEDWDLIVPMVKDNEKITKQQWKIRHTYDQYISDFLLKYKHSNILPSIETYLPDQIHYNYLHRLLGENSNFI